MSKKEALVGIIHSDSNILLLMNRLVKDEGFSTAIMSFDKLLLYPSSYYSFLDEHNPDVLVMGRVDCKPVHSATWPTVQKLIEAEVSRGRGFVLTTYDQYTLKEEIKRSGVLAVVRQPFSVFEEITGNIEEIPRAVRQVLTSRLKGTVEPL